MRRSFLCAAILASLLLPFSGAAQQCELNFISHGAFEGDRTCLIFLDDLGNRWEVTNPRGSWTAGMTGTIYAQFEPAGTCSPHPAVRLCRFDADFEKRVNGTLIIRNLIECPGYIIDTPNQDYLIRNCEDFGADLCSPDNLGRHIQADVFVDTGVSICLGLARSNVLEFRFLQ